MVDLLVLTSLDQFHFKLKILIYICFAKQAALMRRSAVLVLKVEKLLASSLTNAPEKKQVKVSVTFSLG